MARDCQWQRQHDGSIQCPACGATRPAGRPAPNRNCPASTTRTATPPTILTRARNWRDSIKRWKAAGKPVRSEADVERIAAICQACDQYDAKWKQCGLCGCFCRSKGRAEFNKPTMATEACPIGKWGLDPIDVVYPLSTGRHGSKVLGSRWDNNELRYSLRSLEQHFHRLGRVFVVTEFLPDWLTGVEHVYTVDTHRRNKDANLIDKVLAACRAGVSDTFLRASDDQCLLADWDGLDVWHAGDADGQRGGKWWRRCQRTCDYLKANGRPTWFYDCHCPAPVDRDEFVRVVSAADYTTTPGFSINTLYFNSVDIPRQRMAGQKLSVHRAIGPKKLRSLSRGKLFLGYNDRGLNDWLKQYLARRFPMPSRFER